MEAKYLQNLARFNSSNSLRNDLIRAIQREDFPVIYHFNSLKVDMIETENIVYASIYEEHISVSDSTVKYPETYSIDQLQKHFTRTKLEKIYITIVIAQSRKRI